MIESKKIDEFMSEIKLLFSMRDTRPVELDSRLREDLNATSLHYFAMMGTIEELTGKKVGYEQMKACVTMSDAVKLLEEMVE